MGQPWQQDGLDVTLATAQASPGGLSVSFLLTNRGQQPMTLRFTKGQAFSAADSNNAQLPVADSGYSYNLTLQPGATTILDSAHNGGAISFTGNLGDPRVNSVTVGVKGIAGISNARWRIAIQH
jgi:hypothetical protein